MEPFHFRETADWWFMGGLRRLWDNSKKQSKAGTKMTAQTATERLCSVIKSPPTIYRVVHCIHTIYTMPNCQKRNYVQNHI